MNIGSYYDVYIQIKFVARRIAIGIVVSIKHLHNTTSWVLPSMQLVLCLSGLYIPSHTACIFFLNTVIQVTVDFFQNNMLTTNNKVNWSPLHILERGIDTHAHIDPTKLDSVSSYRPYPGVVLGVWIGGLKG